MNGDLGLDATWTSSGIAEVDSEFAPPRRARRITRAFRLWWMKLRLPNLR